MTSPHVLVVEDDREIRTLVARYLGDNDYHVTTAPDGKDLDRQMADDAPDLIILDINLPGEDGLGICRSLRSHSDVPIIMLTAKGEDIDRILGLEMGADDYVTKPFNPRELLARIRAVLRRRLDQPASPDAKVRIFAGWRLDLAARHLTSPEGVRTPVTGAEFDLLQALCEQPGRVLSRERLLEITQGRAIEAYERSIDVLISRLRRKIEVNPRDPDFIKTIRSGGYLFTPTVERQ
ncbi:response regulator [Chelatococcus reniformis]|uniref:Regulatory protein VirG n=1 Tax=Chelatococcus reniformis TaxID=1494448 RepID=A0A916U5G7_9HYPH|nr:response regulator [Chelatococcus reniformis]GGC59776.1 DNA-binding response regulator [Chelatococcus reniformis]